MEIAHQAKADFILEDPSSYSGGAQIEDGAIYEAHACQSQQVLVHIRPGFEVKAVSRSCNKFCQLSVCAQERLKAIEGSLKEVTARKSLLLRDVETLEARLRRVSESISSATYSLHSQRLVPGAVLGNPHYHGLIKVDQAHAL